MRIATRLTPLCCMMALLAACGPGAGKGIKPEPAAALGEAANLLLGSWTCHNEGSTKIPGSVSETSISYLSDGAASQIGIFKAEKEGQPIEFEVLTRVTWSTKDKVIHHIKTYEVATLGTWGGKNVHVGDLNKQAEEEFAADPSKRESDAQIVTLTAKEMVLKEDDGSTTSCKRVET